jgi:uncharacterized protein YraI
MVANQAERHPLTSKAERANGKHERVTMRLRHFALAAGALLVSVSTASAAIVTADLNLRSGPSTRYAVIDAMPAGSQVDILRCSGNWCRVAWGGIEGYASASYLGRGNGYRAYAYEPAPIYVAPPPVVGFGFGFGGWHHGWRGHHWHHGHHGRHH